MIEIKNLYKNFENLQVLKGVSLNIKPKEKVVIIGSSGSGKSTLLRCINLLEKPTFGEIYVEGKLLTPVDPYLHADIIKKSNTFKKLINENPNEEEVVKLIKEQDLLNEKIKIKEGKEYNKAIKEFYKEHHIDINLARQDIGMCFQSFNLFNNYTVLNNLILAPVELKLMTKEEATKKALSLLGRIGLLEKKDEYPSSLSGGQKQRIAIIRSLCMDPKVMLFDEPTSALDPEMVKEVLNVIKDLAKSGMTICIVTHEMEFAKEIASRVLFVDQKSILADNSPENVFNHPENERVKEFLSKL